MNVWQSVAIITAARMGTPAEESVPLLPSLEASTRRALRAVGMSHKLIDQEYPSELLGSALLLITLDPEEFERRIQKAIEKFVARN